MRPPGRFAAIKSLPGQVTDHVRSALDTSTEKDIQNALQHLVEGRSSLSIAHRLSVRKRVCSIFTRMLINRVLLYTDHQVR